MRLLNIKNILVTNIALLVLTLLPQKGILVYVHKNLLHHMMEPKRIALAIFGD